MLCDFFSNHAVLDGLEVDQYMWGILDSLKETKEVDEIHIESNANWKPSMPKLIPKQEDSKGVYVCEEVVELVVVTISINWLLVNFGI